jgi:hypothetical protein
MKAREGLKLTFDGCGWRIGNLEELEELEERGRRNLKFEIRNWKG